MGCYCSSSCGHARAAMDRSRVKKAPGTSGPCWASPEYFRPRPLLLFFLKWLEGKAPQASFPHLLHPPNTTVVVPGNTTANGNYTKYKLDQPLTVLNSPLHLTHRGEKPPSPAAAKTPGDLPNTPLLHFPAFISSHFSTRSPCSSPTSLLVPQRNSWQCMDLGAALVPKIIHPCSYFVIARLNYTLRNTVSLQLLVPIPAITFTPGKVNHHFPRGHWSHIWVHSEMRWSWIRLNIVDGTY